MTILLVSKVRAFVAAQLNDELQSALHQVQQQLQDADSARFVRWVDPTNIHLTFKFLGNVEAGRITELAHAMERAAKGVAAFTLTARGLGCFPSAHRPNNIWVGLEGEVDHAIALARRLDQAFAEFGFEDEARPFSPHLTLGRVKRHSRPAARASVGEQVQKLSPPTLGVISVNAVHLIKSDLRPTGPVYTTLATAHLSRS